MNQALSVSIIVLCYNRSFLLQKYLERLVPQLKTKDRVIVVNNGSALEETRKIEQIIKDLRKDRKGKIFLIKGDKKSNIPRGRNLGIKVAKQKSQIIASQDDDCLPDKNWLERVKSEHKSHPNWGVIQGRIISIPKISLYARITSLNYQNWLKSNLINKNQLLTFDSKNVSFKAKLFQSGIKFNEEYERSSDIELGQNLRKMGYKIGYSSKIKAYHQERTSLLPFLKQHYHIARGESKTGINLFPERYYYHLASLSHLAWELIKEKKLVSSIKLLALVPVILIVRAGIFLSRPLQYKS